MINPLLELSQEVRADVLALGRDLTLGVISGTRDGGYDPKGTKEVLTKVRALNGVPDAFRNAEDAQAVIMLLELVRGDILARY